MINGDPIANIVTEDVRELLVLLERLPLERNLRARIQTLRADIDEALESKRNADHSRSW
jgi:hypothetical protein